MTGPSGWLAELIAASGLSLRELAAKSGVHRNHLSEMLNGSRAPSSLPFNKLLALLEALGAPPTVPLRAWSHPVVVYGPAETDLAYATTPLPTRYAYLNLPPLDPPYIYFLVQLTHDTRQEPPAFFPPGYLLLTQPPGGCEPPCVHACDDGLVVVSASNPCNGNGVSFQIRGWYPQHIQILHFE